MTTKKSAASTFILLCTGTLSALAGEPAPGKPEECRQRVLEEIHRFRKLKAPPSRGPGDEHIGRYILLRQFPELKAETTLILAWAGDKDSVNAVIRDYGLEDPKLERWIEDGHVRYRDGPFWPRELFDVARVMDAHRPDLARKMREEMMRLPKSKARAASPEKPNFDRMSLQQLRQAALNDEEEAMLRWARLDPTEAAPLLTQRMQDKKRSVYEQRLAAQALAAIPDARGLTWLRQAALDYRGGGPGVGMLLAGDAGRKQFFDMIGEFEKKNEELPDPLADAPGELDTELFCKLLPRLLEVRDKALRKNVFFAVRKHRLPAATLTDLTERLRKADYKNSRLLYSLCDSLSYSGWEDLVARQVAHLWADELLKREDTDEWHCGAQLFLFAGLGSKDIAAASARRQVSKSTKLAIEILAEAGHAEDVLLIWAATHAPTKGTSWNWYDRPALGWFATVRLTNHLVAPK